MHTTGLARTPHRLGAAALTVASLVASTGCAPATAPAFDAALDAHPSETSPNDEGPVLDATTRDERDALDVVARDAPSSADARVTSDARVSTDASGAGDGGDAGTVPPALACAGDTCAMLCASAEAGPPDYTREGSGAPVAGASAAQNEALRRVNRYRTAAGLPPFSAHPQVQQAAQAHAAYAARNPSAACRYLGSPHYEEMSCAGFTGRTPYDRMSAAGYRAITPSGEVMAPGRTSATAAVDSWIYSVYHRFGMFRPQLEHLGYGVDGTQHVMLTARTRYENVTEAPLVVFPLPGQSDVDPRFSGNESPQPPVPGDGSFPSGTVISVQGLTIDFTDTPMYITAHALLDRDCRPVAHVAFDERVDRQIRDEGVVYLYANEPLAAGQRYTAHVAGTLGGRPFSRTWSFTTR